MTIGKKHSFEYMLLCPNVMFLLCHRLSRFVKFSFQGAAAPFNFTAILTILSDFGAQENKVPLFPLFPLLFGMSAGIGYHDLKFFEC